MPPFTPPFTQPHRVHWTLQRARACSGQLHGDRNNEIRGSDVPANPKMQHKRVRDVMVPEASCCRDGSATHRQGKRD